LRPIASIGRRSSVNPVRDLRPVCPNCHAVIHWTEPPQTIEQVQQALRNRASPKRNIARRRGFAAPRKGPLRNE
jgi:hypothetical protein